MTAFLEDWSYQSSGPVSRYSASVQRGLKNDLEDRSTDMTSPVTLNIVASMASGPIALWVWRPLSR